MTAKTIFILLGVGVLGVQAWRFQHRGIKLEKTETALRDTSAALARTKGFVAELKDRVNGLVLDSTTLAGEKERLLRRNAQADLEVAQKVNQINQAIADKRAAIAAKTAVERKLETLRVAFRNGDISADRLRDSLSAMPVFTDEQANHVYLNMVAERDMWRESSQKATDALARKTQEYSDLELELNARDKAAQRKQEAINDTRKFVQDERQKASKGIIRKVVNAGKIKTLGEVDQKLSDLPKR
jgi:hypothetical protein